MKTTRKLWSILLTICMIAGLLPAAAIPVRATTDEAVLSLGVGGVVNGDTVLFGTESSAPIKWRVLSALGDTTHNSVDLSDTSSATEVLLLSKYLLWSTYFKEDVSSNEWAGSDAQAWCTSFYSGWSNAAEKAAIKATTITETGNYTGGRDGNHVYKPASVAPPEDANGNFFFLSAKEADNYFANDADRKAYTSAANEASNSASEWWLRSPSAVYVYSAGNVYVDGWVFSSDVVWEYGARPAFNLNPESVLFSSAAAGGKSTSAAGAIETISTGDTTEWKLTLKDTDETTGQHKSFAVTETAATVEQGGTVSLNYSGAATGTKEYVSVLLCNEAGTTALGYGSGEALTAASGTATFTLPNGLETGTYTLKVFNEQKDADAACDYASDFDDVTLTVGAEAVGISLDMGAVAKNDTVWFGTKGTDPIAWRVLSAAGDNTLPVSGSSDVLAIRKYLLLDQTYFKENNSSNAWAGSDAQTWCTTYYNNWPAGAEKDAIKATSVTETGDYYGGLYNNHYGAASLSNEHFFFLSAQEAATDFTDDDDRKAYDAADSGNNLRWWLRSPADGSAYVIAGYVSSEGWVDGCPVGFLLGARPAFNFNLNSVLFSSAAAGGKSTSAAGALDAPAANTTKEWKLTLLDTDETTGQHKNFAVTETTAAAVPGGTVTLTYSGAATGTNEYVSALLCDSTGATVLRYGSSAALDTAAKASGTVNFTVPSDLARGSYKLKVFNEQKNNDYLSDYASAFKTVNLTVSYSVAVTHGGGYTPTYAIQTEKTEHGTVKTSYEKTTSGTRVTITATPDAGYEVGSVTVTDASGNSVKVTKNTNGTYSFTMPASKVTVTGTFVPVEASGDICDSFRDIDRSAWYHDGVHDALEKGIMSGMGDGQFAPSGTTTRAQLAQILWNIEGKPTYSGAIAFTDVNANEWYAPAIRWANAEGIIGGYGDGRFGPNDAITREQLVTILYRYAKYKGVNVSAQASLAVYDDAFTVSDWAREAMQWAVGSGLISGKTASTLNPQDKATRAEIATIIMRYCEEIAK